MLKLHLSLLQHKLNHDTGDQGECDSCHEDEVIGISCRFDIQEGLIDGVRCCCDIIDEVWILGSNPEDSVVHEMGIHCCNILGSCVQIGNHLIEMVLLVSLEELI